ncbi:hypothetical protein NQ314_021166 [Rhamnusium bicolor]|uniref:Pyruvate dehydrogenase E1 component subunit alpha n=1 Tax=Rhamnusium bicolor TaxID=1586634 RepID=A0AAV8WJB2_9CUCU|nr:hypothetical protein NQ314_021166 [Rhamnusium bicolor]
MNKILPLTSPPNKNIFVRKHVIPVLLNTRLLLSTKFENQPYDVHKLDKSPSTSTELSKDDALLYFEQMTSIRRMEASLANLYKDKAVRGFCHLYSGQEACGVGIKAVMRPQDTVITSYRCHGWMILLGATYQDVIAELLAKQSGCARGKGGSMHMYIKNFFGGNGIVGAHIPLGAGIALAHKYTNNGAVSISCYGDGATNQGQVFEAFNISKLHSLPAIFVIENNTYAMGTSIARHAANINMYQRGDYIPGIRLDGMDVLAVREGARFCIEHIISGKGPILLELLTYRYFGHSMSDPGTSYRSRDEIKEVRDKRDPIKVFQNKIISSGLVTEDELKKIEDDVKKDIENAIKTSKEDTELSLDNVAYDIYSEFKGKVKMPAFNHYIDHKNVKW